MAKKRTFPVVLTDDQRIMLVKITQSNKVEKRRDKRAKILLMAADGESDKNIRLEVRLGLSSIHNTLAKFHRFGVEAALTDLARRGRPRKIDDEAKTWIKEQACRKPKEFDYAQEVWTNKLLTKHVQEQCTAAGHKVLVGVAPSKVWTILNENNLKPGKIAYYMENHDPNFAEHRDNVISVYKEAKLDRKEIESESKELAKDRERKEQERTERENSERNYVNREHEERERIEAENKKREMKDLGDIDKEILVEESRLSDNEEPISKLNDRKLKDIKRKKRNVKKIHREERERQYNERIERNKQEYENNKYSGEKKGIAYLSYDEKPGIQALANVVPDRLPSLLHPFVARDYEYVRHGTVTLLGGLDLVTGKVIALVRNTHKSADFIDFLKISDARYADVELIKIVLDNHSIHMSQETKEFLDSRPGRFEFIFTPKHGSWLNQVESFFGKMARVFLKGIRVETKKELVDRIYKYIREVNDSPVIYNWQYKIGDE
jgi:transposase